jgi:hypothetical protein
MAVTPKKIIPGIQIPNAVVATPGLYAAPANTKTIIKKLTFTNNDTVARTVTVHLVASGGTGGATNIITKAYPIGPGATYEAFEAEGQVLQVGDFITAFADVASMVTCHGSGVEVQ